MSNPIIRALLMTGLALPVVAAAQQPLDLAALQRAAVARDARTGQRALLAK